LEKLRDRDRDRDWDWEGKMAAFLLGEIEQVEGAIEIAGLVLDDESKRKLATSLASKELFDQALKVAEGIEEAWERSEALRAIAGGMAKAGMTDWAKEVFDQALKVAEGIEEALWRAEALREIAGEMAKAGMTDWAKEVFERALKVAEGIAWMWVGPLEAIAEGMAKAGMFEQALKVAEKAWERARALREIAEEMAKAGVQDEALWRDALKVAEGIEEARERAGALREIAEGLAEAGEVEGAVGIVEREMAVRTKGLPSVLEVLARRARKGDGKSKEGFLRLLPWCGWSLEFAYKACGLLAWLYPERGEEIAGVVRGE
jgi:tetratricopeptide (TPR) repeat protein